MAMVDGAARASDGRSTVPRRLREPRYQLRVVRGEAAGSPILIWSRHRTRVLARHSKRMEETTPRFGAARLVLWDTRTSTVVE